ncbi:hypothetical protein [Dokdonella immobilis]|uniref:hypothetical protein n=1 Tax=Dokdonella immobilis TaxID=578942 RepID=UPI0011136B6A|nr:hypothetical protein [Dokdonella immobilis]
MKRTFSFSVALSALVVCANLGLCETPEPPPSSPKPSFWQRVKNGVAQGVEQSRTGSKRQTSLSDGLTDSRHQGPVFEPINPPTGGRFQGLFASDDHQKAQLGQLSWPRAAITFTEYGGELACWTIRAKIWSSPRANTVETFRVCDAPVMSKDDLGQAATLQESSLLYLNRRMLGVRVMSGPNTGSERTEGPNPPLEPWNIRVSRTATSHRNIGEQLSMILPRLAWVSGYATDADIYRGSRTIATGFQDSRMWFAGFDPAGNRDAQP